MIDAGGDEFVSAVLVADFRSMFPEFQDSSVYTDDIIEPWLVIATAQLDPNRWRAMYVMGICLFAAHQLILSRQATLVAQRGGIPGMSIGIVQSKSINGVSVSYNTNLSLLQNGGDWNLSVYGIRFIGFARMFGSGGVQIVGADASLVSEAQLIGDVTVFPNF